jgi:protein involved in polysaccharide export with SLBB domain
VTMRSAVLGWLILSLTTASMARAQTEDIPKDILTRPVTGDDIVGPSGLSRTSEDPLLRNPAPPIAGPIDPKLYRVGPGDLIQVQLSGRVSRSWLVAVGPEGYLLIPGAGSVNVTGRTLADARAQITKIMETRFRGVDVEVRLARPRTFQIFLTGQVKSPGAALAIGSSRVSDVLIEGTLFDNASRRRITVDHTDGTREIADLDVFTRIGDASLNPYLRDGDVVTVPVATDFVYAMGAFARPQRFELGPRDSLITLFRLAGDPIPAADVNRALLLRWKDPLTPESLWVHLDDVYGRRVNPPLREGDRIYLYYVPQYHLQHEAVIIGEVNRPGPYPIVEGKHHLSDLVNSAGGFLPTADLSAINVHRRAPGANDKDPELERLLRLSRDQLTMSEYDALNTKLAGLREGYRVEWNRLKANPRELDLLLRDGDVVTVDRLVNSIRIDGQVKRPGILTFRPGQAVRDYIQEAGGFTDRAWGSRVRVTRAVTGQTLPAGNVKSLDPGDFVWVPEKPDKTALDHFRDTLTALAQVATVIIAIRTLK